MLNLLKTEWLKIKKYRAFWWVIGLIGLAYPGISFIFYSIYNEVMHNKGEVAQVMKAVIGNPLAFPEVWHTLAFGTSLFVFIPAIVVIMLITNEYTFKTHRQNIIDGWSRTQFMTSKMLDVVIVSLTVTLLYVIATLIVGYLFIDEEMYNKWSQCYYILLFALQTFAQLSVAFLVAFLVRKAFIAMAIFIFYFFPLEPIGVGYVRHQLHSDASNFFPLEISDRMIPVPAFLGKIDKEAYAKALAAMNYHIIYTVLLTALIWSICFRINSKRDL